MSDDDADDDDDDGSIENPGGAGVKTERISQVNCSRLRGQYQAKRVAARRAGSSYAYDLPGANGHGHGTFSWEIEWDVL